MSKKLSAAIVLAFVAAVLFFPLLFIPVWIYLVWMVRKEKVRIIHDQTASKFTETWLKKMRSWLIAGGISLAGLIMFLIGVGLYNAVYGLPSEEDGNEVLFWIGTSLLLVFILSTVGSLVIFLKGRRNTHLLPK